MTVGCPVPNKDGEETCAKPSTKVQKRGNCPLCPDLSRP